MRPRTEAAPVSENVAVLSPLGGCHLPVSPLLTIVYVVSPLRRGDTGFRGCKKASAEPAGLFGSPRRRRTSVRVRCRESDSASSAGLNAWPASRVPSRVPVLRPGGGGSAFFRVSAGLAAVASPSTLRWWYRRSSGSCVCSTLQPQAAAIIAGVRYAERSRGWAGAGLGGGWRRGQQGAERVTRIEGTAIDAFESGRGARVEVCFERELGFR